MNREELLKSAKPILFNTEMVQALLDGKKTVTRRVIKPQPQSKLACVITHECDGGSYWSESNNVDVDTKLYKSFETGDILYVRETWQQTENENEYIYYEDMIRKDIIYTDLDDESIKWRPSIHMPKAAARIFLKVTYVSVERLQDITEEQAIKEGFYIGYKSTSTSTPATKARQAFMWVWNKIYSDINPWVWVIEFERLEKLEEK